MMRIVCGAVLVLVAFSSSGAAQQVIPLPFIEGPGSQGGSYPEKEFFSNRWHTQVVANVTKPSLIAYKPEGSANGTAVIVCPGGGFLALSIQNEGVDVAKWLNARGITAFVLKYRLAHTGEDATEEFQRLAASPKQFEQAVARVAPLSVADGLSAVSYVRKHAAEWGVSPDRVGIIGFSAGGAVAAAAGFRYAPEGRPAFVAPIYAVIARLRDAPVPDDAPPMFLCAATDDQFGLAPDSIVLYNKWTEAHRSAELLVYAKGGHGFGMHKQGLPSDHWIEEFESWLELQGLLRPAGNGSK